MKNSSLFDSFNFSNLTEKRYLSAPVYFEPMRGSGELLTVAGIVQRDNELFIESLISPKVAENLYGKKGRNFVSLINMVISQLENELNCITTSLDTFSFKMDSVRIGTVTETYADDAKHALKQVAMLHASLCDLQELNESLQEKKEVISNFDTETYVTIEIRTTVVTQRKRKNYLRTVDSIDSPTVQIGFGDSGRYIEKLDLPHSSNMWRLTNSLHTLPSKKNNHYA